MIDQVVIGRFCIGRRREINSVRLASLLDIIVRARQSDQSRVEVFAIRLYGCDAVSCWIAGDEDRQNAVFPMFGGDLVHDCSHLVELFGTDVRTIRKAELLRRTVVQLEPPSQRMLVRLRILDYAFPTGLHA